MTHGQNQTDAARPANLSLATPHRHRRRRRPDGRHAAHRRRQRTLPARFRRRPHDRRFCRAPGLSGRAARRRRAAVRGTFRHFRAAAGGERLLSCLPRQELRRIPRRHPAAHRGVQRADHRKPHDPLGAASGRFAPGAGLPAHGSAAAKSRRTLLPGRPQTHAAAVFPHRRPLRRNPHLRNRFAQRPNQRNPTPTAKSKAISPAKSTTAPVFSPSSGRTASCPTPCATTPSHKTTSRWTRPSSASTPCACPPTAASPSSARATWWSSATA